MFNFLHLELTSRCNKACWMCGRRKMEREKACDWGDMDYDLVPLIARQVPKGTVVQFHNNGEPLLYPALGWVLWHFRHCIRQFNTNGKLLLEKADEIIGNLEVLTISVIENDPEGGEQYEIVKEFVERKGEGEPKIVYRMLGNVDSSERWQRLPGIVAKRILHAPGGSFDYQKKTTIPEIGMCIDLLTHLAIDRDGSISLCVRFDPEGKLRLGHVNDMALLQAWNSPKRQSYIQHHLAQERDKCPGCDRCEYWGVPRGE